MQTIGLTLLSIFMGLNVWAGNNAPANNNEKNKSAAPNIVLIVSDDHGQNDLGCYGNTAIKTPNLDKLSAQGARFTNAHCSSASCSASRSTILTGMYNHATAHYGHVHDYHHFSAYDNVKSLPVLLAELAGYKTARVGKYHVAPEKVFHFEEVIPANGRNAVEMANKCRDFIGKNKDNPFFLYFCTDDPHRGGGNVSDAPLAANYFGNKPGGYPGVTPVTFSPEETFVPPYLPATQECKEELAQYYQSVARMDQGFGRLFAHLKEFGVWDNTIVIYISDNGIAFEGAKTNQYQPGINLPCIVKTTDKSKNDVVVDAFISWTDLTPTILDYAGVLAEADKLVHCDVVVEEMENGELQGVGFHGRSFKPVLETGNSEGWTETFASHTFHEITMYYPMRTLISTDYKLIYNIAWQLPYPQASDLWSSSTWQSAVLSGNEMYGQKKIADIVQRPQFELYNLQEDPYEAHNLAYEPEYKEKLEQLKAKLKDYQKKTSDPWILKWERE
jgi:N-sulfoglucosamine sulfohydrolase